MTRRDPAIRLRHVGVVPSRHRPNNARSLEPTTVGDDSLLFRVRIAGISISRPWLAPLEGAPDIRAINQSMAKSAVSTYAARLPGIGNYAISG